MNKRLLRYILLPMLLMACAVCDAQINNWQDLYKAKKKDTIYGIAHKYGITVDQLMEANPDMKKDGYQLKKGDIVFIPFVSQPKEVQQPSKKSTEKDIDRRSRAIRIGTKQHLHNVDGEGEGKSQY